MIQSAYKRFHSTETALLNVDNDIVDNKDNGKVTALNLLDISAAFDTTDHLILLQCLNRHIGISGTALLAHNTFHSEFRKDRSLALFCLVYILRLSAKSLLIIISVITSMLMTHRFTYHFHNQMHKNQVS